MNESRRFYRSSDDRVIAGVAGGLAEYFNIDPILVRILWVISVPLTGFLSALAYLILMIAVPIGGPEWPAASGFAPGSTPPFPPAGAPEPAAPGAPDAAAPQPQPAPSAAPSYVWESRWQRRGERDRGGSGGIIAGAFLIVLGGLFVWHEIDPRINLGALWPLAIVTLGVILVIGSVGFRRGE